MTHYRGLELFFYCLRMKVHQSILLVSKQPDSVGPTGGDFHTGFRMILPTAFRIICLCLGPEATRVGKGLKNNLAMQELGTLGVGWGGVGMGLLILLSISASRPESARAGTFSRSQPGKERTNRGAKGLVGYCRSSIFKKKVGFCYGLWR